MGYDRTEIVLRADNFQIFDDLVAHLCKLYRDTALFQGPDQRTQYRACGNVDGKHGRKIEDHGPDSRRGTVDENDDLAADVLRIEVEPRARAAHDQRPWRFAGTRISRTTDEVPRGRFASEDDDDRS